jgi:uncharacterized membrane protein SirB2
MPKQMPDNGDRLPASPDALARWRAVLKERISYLALDMAVSMGLLSYQTAHTPDTKTTLLMASVAVLLTVVDLLLKWKRLPHRLLTIVIYVCLATMVISGFFTGTGILWAVIDGVVFLFWAGMYESTRLALEERPGS